LQTRGYDEIAAAIAQEEWVKDEMIMHTGCVVLPSLYRDSVVLMHVSHTLETLPGVFRAAVMMGTPQNKDLLRQAELLTPEGEQAGATDLLVCIQAETPTIAEEALQTARQQVMQPPHTGMVAAAEMAPRTLESALRRLPDANLACISVPGLYARHEALQALRHNLHVFLFSDHVSLEVEAELKQLAVQRGLLVMGPDCGTAVLHGAPLGFANHVRGGPVGLIAASGTGLQHVACLLAQRGIGISQAIGVGGRDLHQRIGAQSMRAALQALAADTATQVIVLISKPPDTVVSARLVHEAARIGKPCVLAFVGDVEPYPAAGAGLYRATTLEEAAGIATSLARGEAILSCPQCVPPHLIQSLEALRAALQPTQRALRALYCGGTLAYEALWLLRRTLGRVGSNVDGTANVSSAGGHVVLDLGAEEFTSGRPHPMIDPAARRQQLLESVTCPDVGVVLCDVILGWGAHPDPGMALATAWQEARALARVANREVIGIATVCGTPDDPQDYERQCRVLREHGFLLADSNAQAVRLAAMATGAMPHDGHADLPLESPLVKGALATCEDTPVETPVYLPALFRDGPRVINLGLEWFATQLTACGVPTVHVDWRPPADGNARLANLLEHLR
jgi:FdrA protein